MQKLCSQCELTTYPERFHACASCRKPIRYTIFCWGCKDGLSKWLSELFSTEDNKDNWKMRQLIDIGIHCIAFIPAKSKMKPMFLIEPELSDPWPGFYAGEDKWIMPAISKDQIDISDINWDNKDAVINRELEKNGIYLYEDIQYRILN